MLTSTAQIVYFGIDRTRLRCVQEVGGYSMKRLVPVLFLTAAGAALLCHAQTNQVLSRNAVGYVRVTCPRGGLVLVRMDFESLDGSDLHAEDVFGDQLPSGTSIYAFDPSIPGYVIDNYSFLGWSTNIVFQRGKGFWIEVPDSAPSNEYQVYLMGEVPDRFTAPTSTVSVASNLSLLGYMYPSDILWTNTELAKNANMGDRLYHWDGTSYVPNTLGFLGWTDPNLVITPGMGFWFETTAAATNWIETKPYTWP